ncbi:MAG: hypothetical protein ACRD9S_23985 [Pyrinomonadaceae bacterium]
MSPAKVKSPTRAKSVVSLFSSVRGFIFDQLNRPGGFDCEREAASNLMLEAGHASKGLTDAGSDDARIRDIERKKIRPLIFALRRFALRRNLTFAEPFWGLAPAEIDTNRVFFIGGDRLRRKLAALCSERDLDLTESAAGWGAGSLRWDTLRTCYIAVFDFTAEAEDNWPSGYHALGTALALGIYPMVVVDTPEDLKFDIDLQPVIKSSLAEGLDRALFGIQRSEVSEALPATISKVVERSNGTDAATLLSKQTLTAHEAIGPLQTEKILSRLSLTNGGNKWGLLFPTWPGSYPEPNQRRCFHVMPFSEPWSNEAREAVRRACGENITYRRGDETEDPNVIRAIWQEICRASEVVVDLTGLNCNVCLELALCHALGRRVLLVARNDGTVERLFPEIAKLQVKKYDTEMALEKIAQDFLSQPATP